MTKFAARSGHTSQVVAVSMSHGGAPVGIVARAMVIGAASGGRVESGAFEHG